MFDADRGLRFKRIRGVAESHGEAVGIVVHKRNERGCNRVALLIKAAQCVPNRSAKKQPNASKPAAIPHARPAKRVGMAFGSLLGADSVG